MKGDYLIYVGNAYPHKNLEKLINAVVQVNKNASPIKLKIISSKNVFTNRLKAYIAKTNSENFVEIYDRVDDKTLNNLYKNSKAFVFPSLSEGFGLPGIEATRAGTLLLASDIPVFKEIYQDNAIYFDPNSVDSMANTVAQMLGMDNKKRHMATRKAQEFVKKYTWQKMAKETLQVYENAV